MNNESILKNLIDWAMNTGQCPYVGKLDCPSDLVDQDLDIDEICKRCITGRYYLYEHSSCKDCSKADYTDMYGNEVYCCDMSYCIKGYPYFIDMDII